MKPQSWNWGETKGLCKERADLCKEMGDRCKRKGGGGGGDQPDAAEGGVGDQPDAAENPGTAENPDATKLLQK